MTSVPQDLKYSSEHEWVDGDPVPGEEVTVGITEHAADALGDIVYVEPPAVGTTVTEGEVCGELESTKAVSELYSPVTGTVVAINDELASNPENVNKDPFGTGWIFKVAVTAAPTALLDAAAYGELTA